MKLILIILVKKEDKMAKLYRFIKEINWNALIIKLKVIFLFYMKEEYAIFKDFN
jgi:hypothetical protein